MRSYQQIQQVIRNIEKALHRYLPDFRLEILGERSPDWGKVNLDRKILYINRAVIEQASWEEIEDLLAHEIGHVFDANRYVSEHGRDWRDITRALGGSGSLAFKDQPKVTFPAERYKYRCADCGLEYGSPYERPFRHYGNHDETHKTYYALDEFTGKRWTITLPSSKLYFGR